MRVVIWIVAGFMVGRSSGPALGYSRALFFEGIMTDLVTITNYTRPEPDLQQVLDRIRTLVLDAVSSAAHQSGLRQSPR